MTAGRFVVDSSLALLARRLRMLGYDVRVASGARLEALCAVANAEGRIVLTTSRATPPPCRSIARLTVSGIDPAEAVRTVAARFSPPSRPFAVCTRCNGRLDSPPAGAAPPEEAPPHPSDLRRCADCGHWYWRGSHSDRMRTWLEAALGRTLE